MSGFVLRFVLVLFLLFTLNMLNVVQSAVVEPFTSGIARLSSGLMVALDQEVLARGKVIRDTQSGFAVSIEAGCNGVEAAIVLIAAVLAFPATWAQRAAAIGLGFLAIQLMNIVRIISLFYLGQFNRDLFEWAHLYLWPTLIMLDVLVVFMLYLRFLAKERAPV